jgi:hypothetical protein
MNPRLLALGLLFCLPLLNSCGGDSTSAPVPSRIIISPGNVSMDALGLTQQFSATVEDGDGNAMSGTQIAWASSNAAVASISSSGLATGLNRGNTSIRASAEGLTASVALTVAQVPSSVEKASGDGQTGALSQPLPQLLGVEVMDSQGNPIPGQIVNFGIVAGAGSLNPSSATTDAQGLATSIWTLGCSNDNPQEVVATASGQSVNFSATADLNLPAICDLTVPDGRATLPYSTSLVAVGGDPGSMAWSVQDGDVPPGLTLSAQGLLSGTPTQSGHFAFQARAQDGMGNYADGAFDLQICEAPLALAPGGSVTIPVSGLDACGFLIPAGNVGDRYRLGVTWATSNSEDDHDIPTVAVSASMVFPLGVSPHRSPVRITDRVPDDRAHLLDGLPEHLREAIEVDATTEAFHNRLREKELEMIRGMGPGAGLLPDRKVATAVSGPQRAAPEKLSLFSNSETSCSATAKVTALLVAENEQIAFYQDSAQAQVDSLKLTVDIANQVLDYYRDYGEQVIQEYFGGVTDINNDGQIVVFVTPAVSEGVAAFVWSGDFFSTGSCGSSNEMELVRFSASTIRGILTGKYQAFGTLVHEAKHVSSLYKGIARYNTSNKSYSYHPHWIEEGTAEIAAEMSSRVAWAATGGPEVGEMIVKADKEITKESYGVLLRWVRVIFHLGLQPNGLVATPEGADESHTLYGSGWHFHRWLGDSFGNAALSPKADAPLFTTLNDSLTAPGVQGLNDVTGRSWNELMDEYLSALLLNGTGAPQPEWGITSYDFPDVTSELVEPPHQPSGIYPWAVNVSGDNITAPFSAFLNQGPIGPSGVRVYDLTSEGVGLGLEVEVETTRDPVRVTIVRIQ